MLLLSFWQKLLCLWAEEFLLNGTGPLGNEECRDHPHQLIQEHIGRCQQLQLIQHRQHHHHRNTHDTAQQMDGDAQPGGLAQGSGAGNGVGGSGQVLLGVERSVFLRTGFIRFSDLSVTDDEALRRRLNSLVTTGDESGAGDALAQKLKDLKNKIRYNRTGLLPQAEAQRAELENKISELLSLQNQGFYQQQLSLCHFL